MKRLTFLFVAWASFMTLTVQAQWTVVYNGPQGPSGSFSFPDSLHGWFPTTPTATTDKILRTTDGGNTFETQYVPAGVYNLYCVFMEDTLTGWAAGGPIGNSAGVVLKTTNGGINWVQQSIPGPKSGWITIAKYGNSTWFAGSANNGTSGAILRTSDGGINWEITLYAAFTGFTDFVLFDDLNFVAAGPGFITRTSDGGTNWITTNVSPEIQAIRFVNNGLGYALGTVQGQDGYLYISTDGGFTWNEHYTWIAQGWKPALSVIPGTNIIFVGGILNGSGNSSGILKSTDAGGTWNVVYQTPAEVIQHIYTPDERHGWAEGAFIYRYDYVEPPTIEPISNKLIQFGQAFTYQVQATGMGLEYSMSGHPTGLNIGAYSGLINGVPIEGGKFDITVAVQDTDANVVTEDFRLKVNRKPLFIPPFPSTHAWVDSLYQFQLSVEDVDDDTVSFTWLSKPNWLVFLTAGITNVVISGVPTIADTGYVNISVLADDGYGGQDTLSWILQVELYLPPVNHAPQFVGSWPDTVLVYQDSSYTWDFLFQDIDGDTLFTIPGQIGVPGLSLLEGSGLGTLTAQVQGQPTDTGWYLATVAVQDEHGGIGQLQFTVQVDLITGIDPFDLTPTAYSLEQNYPNPFNPTTTIEYTLPKATWVELKIYNLLGQEVVTLLNQEMPAGNHKVTFNGQGLPSGIYYYQLRATPIGGQVGTFTETKKMVLLK